MDEQKKPIIVDFISLLIQKVSDFLEPNKIYEIFGKENFKTSIFSAKTELKEIPAGYSEELLQEKIASLISFLSIGFGETFTDNKLEDIYSTLQKKHSPVLANKIILPLIPAQFLEKYRLEYLSKEELEAQILAKTSELRKLNAELEEKVEDRTKDLRKLLEEHMIREEELSRANRELRELDRRKTEFLSIVAHQLRTPLSGLKWTFDMLIKGDLGPLTQNQIDILGKCYEGNERLIALINQMLSANALDSEKYELTKTKNDIIILVKEVIAGILPQAIAKKITIDLKEPKIPIPAFIFDNERIRDVFLNLIDNAVKYSLPGGKVTIELTQKDKYFECSVKDSGIGIPADQKQLIFSRFFRAANARTIDPNGNGLGLFIVEHIVKLHGGKIWFESEENKFTNFYFTLEINY